MSCNFKTRAGFNLALELILFALILIGCAVPRPEPIRLCPSAESTADALLNLRLNSQNAVSLKALGQCILRYYDDDKKIKKEKFNVRIWLNPPDQIRLHGDIFFNARGIDLGSNEHEFWLALKPNEMGNSYQWGKWSEVGHIKEMMLNPKLVLEAFGIVDTNGGNWHLSNKQAFDVLTKQDKQGRIVKKIYINTCDYTIARIEYFDRNTKVSVVTELTEHKQISEGFFAPTVIRIVNAQDNEEKAVSITLNLKSVKSAQFSEKLKDNLFIRPRAKAFEHIYRIIEGEWIKQQ